MRVLVAVADSGSLSAGARRLAMPLATVSRKVTELEAALGARLLVRSSRRLGLSEVGETYVAACRRILDQIGEAERIVAGEYVAPRGELAVTAPITFGRIVLLPIVNDFLRAYPEIDLRLLLNDRSLNLLEEQVDVALRIGALPDSHLVATKVGEVRLLTCASPKYLQVRGQPRLPSDLREHACISFAELVGADCWRYANSQGEQFVEVKSRLIVNTAEAAVDAAVAGVGITRVLSYQAEPACLAGTLRGILDEHAPAPLPVSLLFSGQGPLPLKLRAFLDFVKPRLRERLMEISTTVGSAGPA